MIHEHAQNGRCCCCPKALLFESVVASKLIKVKYLINLCVIGIGYSRKLCLLACLPAWFAEYISLSFSNFMLS